MSNTPNQLTTSTGSPVGDNLNSETAGEYGPILLQDFHVIDKLSHFDRERIPERVVHAKGAGAHGYFEVTNDITKYCKSGFLSQVGKKTPCFTRFSVVAGEKGSADSERDPRGFSVKMYTEEGNYDFVGNSTPVFFIRDTIKFPDLIHSQKKNPQTNLKCANTFWDFLSLTPESAHQVTVLFSDRGTPATFQTMNGYSGHTFKWVNKAGEQFWVKIHFITDQGIKNLNLEQSQALRRSNPDHATQDMFQTISKGTPITWSVKVQVMPFEDGFKYKWNIFDITKVWPHADYPLITFGKMILNRNPENYFQDVEQSAFSPGHLVPGFEPSFDKMLQGRLFSYPDTHRHRLGANYDHIPINCPYRAKVHNCIRDGPACTSGNQGSKPNYEPNSMGPKGENVFQADPAFNSSQLRVTGLVGRYKPAHPNCDFAQPGVLYRKVMTDSDRTNLLTNLWDHMRNAKREIQERQVKIFVKCDPEYGQKLAQKLGFPADKSRL